MQLRPPGITLEDATFVERAQVCSAAVLRAAAAIAAGGSLAGGQRKDYAALLRRFHFDR